MAQFYEKELNLVAVFDNFIFFFLKMKKIEDSS